MDPNFQELAREIIQEVEARVKTHLDQFESRAEQRMQMHFENLEGAVRLTAEGYAASLEGIDRQLAEMNTQFRAQFGDHALVLRDHEKRIGKLEESA